MAQAMSSGQAVNILWTGGWDSTFQVLRLLLDQRLRVQPFYLLDAGRGSTDLELLTMGRIRDRLFQQYPHTRDLLAPVRQFAVSDTSPDAEITGAYSAVRARLFLGNQYDWLARFCKQHGISDMQLCIHRDDKAYTVVKGRVVRLPRSASSDGGAVCRLDPALSATDEYRLFGSFTFPLLELTKVGMGRIARRRGWGDIMEMTWFCQAPTRGQRPCGACNPCVYTIQEGLGRRLPLTSWLRYLRRRGLRTARDLAGDLLRAVGLR